MVVASQFGPSKQCRCRCLRSVTKRCDGSTQSRIPKGLWVTFIHQFILPFNSIACWNPEWVVQTKALEVPLSNRNRKPSVVFDNTASMN